MSHTPTLSEDASHAEIVAALTNRWPEHRVAPSLGRIAALTELLGDPQRAYPVIHVTGTNGKGSTAAMIEALLRANGLRTGRFSSPHVTSVTERIAINGEPLSESRFDDVFREIAPYVDLVDAQQIDGVAMTFFEIITAMAYAAFADAPVDVAVVEVGLGGTWDATNVADGDVAVITPIDLDHTHLLGSTVAEIATEKAGIIKPGALAILAGQSADAAHVLLERSAEVGALVQREGIEFGVLDRVPAVGGQLLRLMAAEGSVDEIFLPLYGAHQAANAAQALAAAEAFLGMKALNPGRGPRGLRERHDAGPDGGRPSLADRGAGRRAQPARGPGGRRHHHRGVRLHPAGRRARRDGRQGRPRDARDLGRGDAAGGRHPGGLDESRDAGRRAGRAGGGSLRRRAGHRRPPPGRRHRDRGEPGRGRRHGRLRGAGDRFGGAGR